VLGGDGRVQKLRRIFGDEFAGGFTTRELKVKLSLCSLRRIGRVEVQLHPFFDLGTRRR
jgi:hypothetical protein